jgi:HEAT repeat protein
MADEKRLVEDLFSSDSMAKASAESALYDANQAVVPSLLDVIGQVGDDKNRGARRICAWVIYKIGSRISEPQARASAVSALITALKDPDEGLRKNAAWGLIPIGGRAALEPLRAACQDKSADVRDAAQYALEQVSSRG